jgi:uncharacterized protein (DUF1778 family)
MKIMVGFKVSPKFKAFLQDMAEKENRSLSNFIINAVLTYIEEKHGINWREEKPKK